VPKVWFKYTIKKAMDLVFLSGSGNPLSRWLSLPPEASLFVLLFSPRPYLPEHKTAKPKNPNQESVYNAPFLCFDKTLLMRHNFMLSKAIDHPTVIDRPISSPLSQGL